MRALTEDALTRSGRNGDGNVTPDATQKQEAHDSGTHTISCAPPVVVAGARRSRWRSVGLAATPREALHVLARR